MLQKIMEAARAAGEIIRAEGGARVYRKEGHYNFVTEADMHVQQMLQQTLSRICPEAVFYA